MSDDRSKIETCLWCGQSEALGAVLRQMCASFGGRDRYECADRAACDARIKRRILLGP